MARRVSKRQLTGKDVIAFWKYMGSKYGFRVVQKANAEEMQAIGWALDMMGVQSQTDFMRKYTTTIGTTVYVPFKIGKGNQTQLRSQIITCVHESEHVVQFKRNRGRFIFNYLSSDAARAHYEAEAYLTNMEMYFFFTGTVLAAGTLANTLRGYGVGHADIRVTKKHLSIAAKVVRNGDVISNTSKTAIRWLKKRKI